MPSGHSLLVLRVSIVCSFFISFHLLKNLSHAAYPQGRVIELTLIISPASQPFKFMIKALAVRDPASHPAAIMFCLYTPVAG
jgi:hypothetical protein